MTFDAYIGIDYSGAALPVNAMSGLQVYWATAGTPERVPSPSAPRALNWCRRGIAEWLIEQARGGKRFIAGIDHAFSFPKQYFDKYRLRSWHGFLNDFVEHWPTHEPKRSVDSLLQEGRDRRGESHWFRLTDRRTNSARSVFDFAPVQGMVAKSTHAGIPWLWHIRNEVGDQVHFWPFDGWEIPEDKSVIAEVYPSLFRRRFDTGDLEDHELDAFVVSLWLQTTCGNGFVERYLAPPLTAAERETAMLEGWILGIA